MDIQKFEYFIKVAETLNFRKAAEQLHVSHQALSKQIQQLEQECGAKLLERTTTKVALTEVGVKTYDIFKPVVREYHQGLDELSRFVKFKKDILRIGYFGSFSCDTIIQPLIRILKKERPQLRVNLLSTDLRMVMELLEHDNIDLAIAPRFDTEWDRFPYVTIKQELLKIIVSENHPWYTKDEISWEDYAQGVLLVYDDRPREGAGAFLEEFSVRERIAVPNTDSFMNMLRQGDCFGVISENYSKREGSFRLMDLPEGRELKVPTVAIFKKLHPLVDVMQKLEGALEAE